MKKRAKRRTLSRKAKSLTSAELKRLYGGFFGAERELLGIVENPDILTRGLLR